MEVGGLMSEIIISTLLFVSFFFLLFFKSRLRRLLEHFCFISFYCSGFLGEVGDPTPCLLYVHTSWLYVQGTKFVHQYCMWDDVLLTSTFIFIFFFPILQSGLCECVISDLSTTSREGLIRPKFSSFRVPGSRRRP